MSTLGSYAQATTGNAAVDTVIRVQKSLFATVATGLAASALVGIKAKELYDDNKQAVYDGAIKAYDTMSDSAKESWASAVARGRTGVDMSKELWDKLTGVITDVFSSHSTSESSIDINSKGSYYGGSTITFDFGKNVYVHWYIKGYEDSPSHNTYQYITGMSVFGGSEVRMNYYGVTPVTVGGYSTDGFAPKFLDNFVFNINDNVTISDIMSAINAHTKYHITFGSTVNVIDPIYDQALKRALDTDIPRMKDAGMVLPQVDVRTPVGTRVNYDAQAGTVTLPDGSTYDGDLIAGNIPDAVVNGDDVSWHDTKTNTDTNIWDGSVTDSITGDTVPDVGENAGTAEGEAGAVDAGDLPAETDIENVPVRGIVWTPLVQSAQDLTERFPFSIPWDLSRMLGIFNTDPETPKFDIDIKKYVEIDGKTMGMKWTLDFSFLDPLAAVGRWFLIIVFDIAMILGIRKIMPE